MAPDLRRKVDATRTARLAREAEAKKQELAQVSQRNTYDSTPPDHACTYTPTSLHQYLAPFIILRHIHSTF